MKILSKREIVKAEKTEQKYFFDIVFEWEDIFSEILEVDIETRSRLEYKFDEVTRKIYKKTKIPFYKLFRIVDFKRATSTFMFDMAVKRQDGIYNNHKYIPCAIDYFHDDQEYSLFVKAYKNNAFVLISSREVYEYLKLKQCPIKLYHFPLSLPDHYVNINQRYEKKYDLILFARQNPVLMRFVDEYEYRHKDFSLVRRRYENGHFEYYLSKTGEVVGLGDTREEYWNLVKMSKVALYTTPSMDETRPYSKTHGWNQVTPHFLEEIAGQCHVIARYPDNADTRWYELDKMCTFVDSYEKFEEVMDEYLSSDVDLQRYGEYLEHHVTSKSAELLKEIMEENAIL